MRNTVTVDN